LGGPGAFHASIWVSAGDKSGQPVPFSTASPAVEVALFGTEGTKVVLAPAKGPLAFGEREWVLFATEGDVALPAGGTFSVELADLALTLQLAAPEVTSSALGGPSTGAQARRLPINDRDRRVLAEARRELDGPPRRRRSTDQ